MNGTREEEFSIAIDDQRSAVVGHNLGLIAMCESGSNNQQGKKGHNRNSSRRRHCPSWIPVSDEQWPEKKNMRQNGRSQKGMRSNGISQLGPPCAVEVPCCCRQQSLQLSCYRKNALPR
ncbi:hypothetical protein U1Q18_034716 [Sarracenia purpurea var. burkii]